MSTSKYAERAKEISTKLEKYWVQDGIYLHGASAFLEGLMVETCEAVALEANQRADNMLKTNNQLRDMILRRSTQVAVMADDSEVLDACERFRIHGDIDGYNDWFVASFKHKTLDELWPTDEEFGHLCDEYRAKDPRISPADTFYMLKAFMTKKAKE